MFWFSILLLRVSELAPRSNTCRAPSGEACNPHPDRAETLPPRRRPAVRAAVLASPALATGLPAAPGVWIALQACQSRLLEQVATWRVLPLCHRGRAASHSLAHTAPDRRFAARSRQQSSSLLLREAAARSCCGRARLVGLLCVGRGVVRTRAKSAAGSLTPAQRVPPSPPPPPPAASCFSPSSHSQPTPDVYVPKLGHYNFRPLCRFFRTASAWPSTTSTLCWAAATLLAILLASGWRVMAPRASWCVVRGMGWWFCVVAAGAARAKREWQAVRLAATASAA